MAELRKAATRPGPQCASLPYLPLVDRPLPVPPGADFQGQRPLVDLKKMTKKNLLFARFFHVDDNTLDSDLLRPLTGSGLEDDKPFAELKPFKSIAAFQRAKIARQNYAQAVTPPLLSAAEEQRQVHIYLTHQTYAKKWPWRTPTRTTGSPRSTLA